MNMLSATSDIATSDEDLPFADLRPELADTESEWRPRLDALLRRAQFVLGSELAGFETEFASALAARHAIGVGSGTAALELSLRAMDRNINTQEVITSALTAPFTAVAIAAAGYLPRFADVDPDTLLVSADNLASRVNKSTAAVIPVHLFGQPCDMRTLVNVLQGRRVEIVQDACQAHGADCDGTPFTEWSRFVAYSFYPTKNLGCAGDSGAVLTNSAEDARKLRALRDGGRDLEGTSVLPGVNARLDEIQACLLRVFLSHLNSWNLSRRRLASVYTEALRDCENIRIIPQRAGSVYHLFVIRAERREELRRYLSSKGIGTGIHYPKPLHLHPAFQNSQTKRGDLPNAEKACEEILSLPIRPHLKCQSVLHVADSIRKFYRGVVSSKYVHGHSDL